MTNRADLRLQGNEAGHQTHFVLTTNQSHCQLHGIRTCNLQNRSCIHAVAYALQNRCKQAANAHYTLGCLQGEPRIGFVQSVVLWYLQYGLCY